MWMDVRAGSPLCWPLPAGRFFQAKGKTVSYVLLFASLSQSCSLSCHVTELSMKGYKSYWTYAPSANQVTVASLYINKDLI